MTSRRHPSDPFEMLYTACEAAREQLGPEEVVFSETNPLHEPASGTRNELRRRLDRALKTASRTR